MKNQSKTSTSKLINYFVRDSKVVFASTCFGLMAVIMGVLVFSVSVSAASYSIIYDDNVVSNMPVDESGTTLSTSVNISSNTPTRDGSNFLKWCSQVPASDGTCGGTEYSPGGVWTISQTSANNLKLYAVWKEEVLTMQSVTSAKLAALMPNVGDTTTLPDARDNQTYTIGKLADGKYWMLDNLALDPTTVDLATLQGNTNASNQTLTYFKNGGGSSPYPATGVANRTSGFTQYNRPDVNTASKDIVPSGAMSGSKGNNKVGVYYNYCAASAGSYCYASGAGTGNASEDICPSGWRMPTGNTTGEYQALYTAYSSNATNFKTALSTPLSGRFYSSSATTQGIYGYFWSSTYYDGNYMYDLYVYSSSVSPADRNTRGNGYSVRCVAQ